ncbi:MAG: hypothetical protein R2865_08410 [Deinococcales bacterium]
MRRSVIFVVISWRWGLEPACVTVSVPAEAILIGDLNDPQSKVATIVGRQSVNVRRPEKHTQPKMYYVGIDQTTLRSHLLLPLLWGTLSVERTKK